MGLNYWLIIGLFAVFFGSMITVHYDNFYLEILNYLLITGLFAVYFDIVHFDGQWVAAQVHQLGEGRFNWPKEAEQALPTKHQNNLCF